MALEFQNLNSHDSVSLLIFGSFTKTVAFAVQRSFRLASFSFLQFENVAGVHLKYLPHAKKCKYFICGGKIHTFK